MSKTNKIVLGIAALAIVLLGVAVVRQSSVFGGGSGPSHYQKESFLQGLYGGTGRQFEVTNTGAINAGALLTANSGVLFSSYTATSSAGTVTYTAANITNVDTILHNATGAVTASFPASTTLSSLVPNTGDRREIVLTNVGTGAITLAGGTGTLLTSASSTKVIVGGGSAILELVRKANTDIAIFMTGGSF